MVNAMVKEGLPEGKLQEKLNKYHRPENCESLTKVRVNQSIWDHTTPAVRSQLNMLGCKRCRRLSLKECVR